jgi:hypothetical protein
VTGLIIRKSKYAFYLLAMSLSSILTASMDAQSGLSVTYGAKGVQTITFQGMTLDDIGEYPADSFHIWHMGATDLNGNQITSGQYGWGENNNAESWNAQTNTETYTFSWGTIATQFIQNGNNLDMVVTEVNNSGSGIIFDGAEVYPFALHFPLDPFGGYTQYAITTTGPGVTPADYGAGVVTSVIPDESVALYGGWKMDGTNTYTPIMTSTAPDGLATFLPRNNVPVQPGSSFTYRVSIRFTPEGTAANASDAYASFAATYPNQMTWTDKRIIGTAYLASSPSESNITLPDGYPTNPRRYFNDSTVDVTTPAGLQIFQDRMLAQAQTNVTTAQALNSQGVITWDLEGEQYAQSTSYVCSPDQIATVAPEMESTITDITSPFFGRKLDDSYFQIMSGAGFKVGVCLRPQIFTFGPNGTAAQLYITGNSAIIANLENKARYANGRWGATIFYVDSTVDTNGGTLDPSIFQQLITDLPNFLFIPEESTPRYYAYSAPFYSFLFQTKLGTPASTYNFYPNAFGANLVNDVSASTLATYTPQLTQSVAAGDILMGIGDFWQANDPTLVAIYQAAGVASPTSTQTTPVISWSSPAPLTYGTALSTTQLDASASVAGSFSYSPGAGTTLSAGTDSLLVTFTPADTKNYKSATASTTISVTQAVPVVTWPALSTITSGTALSSAQLNAIANIPGTFSYTPSAGTVLPVGTSTLSVTFTPSDTVDYESVSASNSTSVTAVAQTTPSISWASPAAITYGTALTSAQLNASASVPGTFLYSPSSGTVLSAGINVLHVTFTPFDTTDYASTSGVANLVVSQAIPALSWAAPASVTAGTALSAAQLNATANVPGTFVYSPAAGTILNAGTTTLQVIFVPADSVNYTTQTAAIPITVLAAALPNVNLAVLSPSSGTSVAGTIYVAGFVNLFLDSAGTYLMVDGQELGTQRRLIAPFLYPLDTTTLSNGPHTLQLWGHDIGNNTTISAPVTIIVAN